MNRPPAPQPRTLARASILAVSAQLLLAPTGCAVTERRIIEPQADWAAAEVEARVEVRHGKRKATWKPIVAGLLTAATAGAVSMIWVGFLTPNRPMAVAGIVGSVAIPTLGTVPFLLRQDVPWVATQWSTWAPARNERAQIDIVGRRPQPLATQTVATDPHGTLHIPLSTQLCGATTVRDLQLVDLVMRVDDAERASLSLPLDRLRCGGGRLSLLDTKEPEHHDAR